MVPKPAPIVELARFLRLKKKNSRKVSSLEQPLEGDSQLRLAQAFGPGVRKDKLVARASTGKRVLLRILPDVNGEWEDEFDLRPYFQMWQPSNFELGSIANQELATEIFEMLQMEVAGWVKVYRTAMRVANERDGTGKRMAGSHKAPCPKVR